MFAHIMVDTKHYFPSHFMSSFPSGSFQEGV